MITVWKGSESRTHYRLTAVDPARGVAPEATQLPATVERFGRPLMESVVPGSQLSRAALFGALLDYLERTDVDFRKAALPVSATTAEHVELLGRRWVESVSSPAAQQVLQRAGAQCGEQCTAGLQEVLREIIAASTANGPKRLLQELELRYFQGKKHFGAPRAPSSCLQPVQGGALTMDIVTRAPFDTENTPLNGPSPANLTWNVSSASKPSATSVVDATALPSAVAASGRQSCSWQISLTARVTSTAFALTKPSADSARRSSSLPGSDIMRASKVSFRAACRGLHRAALV